MEALPSVGRIVHYHQSPGAIELAAVICRVHHETMVNLAVFDGDGQFMGGVQDVPLVQFGESGPPSGHFAKWPMSPTLAKLRG